MKEVLIKVLNSTRWSLLVFVILFTILNSLLFLKLGIKVVDDSPRYLGYADRIMEMGFFFDPHEFWYISYPLFMILVRMVHDSMEMVIISQVLLSLGALVAIYLTSLKLFKNPVAAFLTGFLYMLFFEISIYNYYILCESFFVSMTCISLYFLVKWYKNEITPANIILGTLVLVLTLFAKPTGIVLLAAIISYWIYRIFASIHRPVLKICLGLGLLIPLFLLGNKMLTTFSFMNEYIRGDVIFGMFQYKNSPHYELLTVARPDTLYIPDAQHSPLVRLFLFVLFNPIYWGTLFLSKIFLFLFHIRPFWSTWHNLFSLIYLIPVYYFAMKAIRKKTVTGEESVFVMVYILFHAMIVGIMTEDWDGRFLIPVLPVILIPAGLGISHLFAENEKKPKLHFVTDNLENSFLPKF
ncbi:glycosyltransferase family 39 protein [Cognataquiflexum aquatile]|uniref:glycosyltransferase family 39 protein n=1 Tax=Cognataquiflexum aquatile TaxID=2249427 RepID=UPI000DEA5628|nr:glycosyltransferase family 39 protein [Cognataquiflexum aquatile]